MCTKRSLLATLIVINPYLPINVAPLSPAPAMALDLNALRATEKQTINLFEVTTPSVVYIDTFTQRLDVVNMNIMGARHCDLFSMNFLDPMN